jgi:oligopeptidase B
MKTKRYIFVLLYFTILGHAVLPAQQAANSILPPSAKIQPTILEKHGDQRVDNYFWLNARTNPEVIAYLEAENAYTESMMAHTKDLQEKLFEEFKTRIKQTDISVPYKQDDYYYYSRTEDGKDYPIYCRKKGSLEAAEEIMLDVNELAKGHDFYAVSTRAISANQELLAFAADTVGRRIYTLRFKNLTTGEMLSDVIPAVTGNAAWANDNKTLFYAKQDPVTLRSYRIYRHELDTEPSTDVLVYEEQDETFSCFVFKTKSKKYIMIASSQTLGNEYRYLDANNPKGSLSLILPRERNHEYRVDHYGDNFYIRTNDRAKNFRLVRAPVANPSKKNWKEVIPHRNDVFLQGFELFRDHLIVAERKNGLIQMRIRPWSGKGEHYIDFGEPAYAAYLSTNLDFNTTVVRYGYTSMTTPNSIYDYDMVTKERTLLKRDEVLGGFDSKNYQTERLYATASDGKKIPISIVYRKGMERNGKNPLLLYGYGSYGSSQDAEFNAFRISLLDRGFTFALAHIRGGQEMGREWYENGKLFKKKNTFTDFIACAEHLISERYTSSDRLFIQGGSAGGLLIGAVINMRPDLFKGAIAAVPFVDVVTTMLDPTIPLTTSEYDEWGDPNKKEYYEYMLSYSPYDNIDAKRYPNLLVTTGLHDSQVQYFEPAKWVAKLRALKTDTNTLLLHTEMEAGHGGASGRYKRYREIALQYAFLLMISGSAQ